MRGARGSDWNQKSLFISAFAYHGQALLVKASTTPAASTRMECLPSVLSENLAQKGLQREIASPSLPLAARRCCRCICPGLCTAPFASEGVAAEEVCEWGLGLHRRLARALTCPPSQRPGSFAFVCYIVVYVCLRTAICKAPWKGSANRFLDLDYRKLCWHQRQLPLVFALLFIIAIPGGIRLLCMHMSIALLRGPAPQ